MIIDHINNASRYASLHPLFQKAFTYIQHTDLENTEDGRYELEGDRLIAIIQSYQTKDPTAEQLESHKRYIDIQYVITGAEQMGHSVLREQQVSKPYIEDDDFMLYSDTPDRFIQVAQGSFTIFYPTDLHMPCIQVDKPATVKKLVMKITV